MHHTRRDFVHASLLLAAALPLARLSAAAAPAPGRRGLLFDPADLPRIRANTRDPRLAGLWASMLQADRKDDTDFLEHRVRLTSHRYDFLRVQKILERASMVYLVNGDPAQAELARLALRRLVDFPEWDLFTEGGRKIIGLQRASEGSFAVLLALDCLGDAVPAAERAAAEQAVLTKGAPACYTTLYGMKYPDRVQGWDWNARSDNDQYRYISLKRWPLILNSTNLKVIPTACLGIIACRFRGQVPEAEVWLEMARSSAKAFSTMYGTDGCYDEGAGYWGYTTLFLALFAEVLWRTQGIDDRHLVNYSGTVRYGLVMTDPVTTGNDRVLNFGDAGGQVDVSVAAWVQRTQQDPVAQYIARDIGGAGHPLGLVWYDPQAPVAPPEPALLDHRMTNDIVVSRTGWRAPSSVLALRSGGPANHEHADRNSLIFTAHGERLLHDPYHAAYARTEPRWLLRQTEAHTAVLIDGRGHQYHDGAEGTNASWAVARVTAFATGPGWMTVTSDATEAYNLANPRVTRAERTVVFLKPEVFVILDRVAVDGAPVTVQLRFQVNNEDGQGQVTVVGDGFEITRPQATLRARCSAGLAVRTGRLAIEEKDHVFPYAEAGAAAAAAHELVTVCTARPKGAAHGELAIRREGGAWRITGTHAAQTVDVTLTPGASGAPAVKIA